MGIVLLMLSPCLSVKAETARVSLTSGIDISTGKYGGTSKNDVTYIPIIGKYETDDWIFKLTVPYIKVTGPGNVTPNIGQAVYANNAVRTDAGLGDVVAGATYSLINSGKTGTVVDLAGKIKFGTASKFNGLGTGANDYSGGLSLYKIFGKGSVFGSAGYKVFGQSLGYTLNNTLFGSVGAGNKLNERHSIGLIYDYREATSAWSDPQQMWTLYWNAKVADSWKVQSYLFTGAGKSSPDIGGGILLTEIF